MSTARVPLPAPDNAHPWKRLEPVVAALIAHGNKLSRRTSTESSYLGPSKEGYIAQLAQPIDRAFVEATFELPPDVVWDAWEHDSLSDGATWTRIYGGIGEPLPEQPDTTGDWPPR